MAVYQAPSPPKDRQVSVELLEGRILLPFLCLSKWETVSARTVELTSSHTCQFVDGVPSTVFSRFELPTCPVQGHEGLIGLP